MGTDIHMLVQVQEGESWVDRKVPNYWHTNGYPEEAATMYRLYIGRSYDTFAILAGVRNGSGFAGVITGDGFNPISEPRGLPEDMTVRVNGGYDLNIDGEEVWLGDHSHSWLLLSEIEAYDWNQATYRQGIISQTVRAKMLEEGADQPEEWCGGISGDGIKMVSLAEMDARIVRGETSGPREYYTTVRWPRYYYQAAGYFYTEILPLLQKTREEMGNAEVRIVFGFDS